jgi:hypothetical protein
MKKLMIPVFVCATVAASGAFANCRSLDKYYPPGAIGSDPDSQACKNIDKLDQEIHREYKLREAHQKELAAREDRCTAGLGKLRIGMTEAEARPIIACVPLPKVNTDQTVNGVRKQVVLYFTETKAVGYLYFDNGILTAIQRR